MPASYPDSALRHCSIGQAWIREGRGDLREGDEEAGMLVGQLEGRRVYRVVCLDGGDAIARDVRNEGII